MAGKVLLINLNQCTTPYPVFPLGLAHLAAEVEALGHQVKILDLLCHGVIGLLREQAIWKPEFIGISLRNIDDGEAGGPAEVIEIARNIIEALRGRDNPVIIIGGSGFSLFPHELYTSLGVDFGIIGEGERSFGALLAALELHSAYDTIPGLVYMRDRVIVVNGADRGIEGRLIRPALRPEELAEYYRSASSMLSVQTQRGCPFSCCYCSYPLLEGHRSRYREARTLGDELERVVTAGCTYLFFTDSLFNTSDEHVNAVCGMIIERKLKFNWCCFMRPAGLTSDMVALMKRAGCSHIEFGTDSLCDRVLDAYAKGFSLDDILRASELCHQAAIHQAHFLLLGGPGETDETLSEGLNNLRYIKKAAIFICAGMHVYPGTPLQRIAVREGVIDGDVVVCGKRRYISPFISELAIVEAVRRHQEHRKSIIFGPLPEACARSVQGLRHQVGIKGPLWEFLAG